MWKLKKSLIRYFILCTLWFFSHLTLCLRRTKSRTIRIGVQWVSRNSTAEETRSLSGTTSDALELCWTRKLGIATRRPVNLNSCTQNDPQLKMRLLTRAQRNQRDWWPGHSYALVVSLVSYPHKFFGQGKEVGSLLLPCRPFPGNTFFTDGCSSSPVLCVPRDMHWSTDTS